MSVNSAIKVAAILPVQFQVSMKKRSTSVHMKTKPHISLLKISDLKSLVLASVQPHRTLPLKRYWCKVQGLVETHFYAWGSSIALNVSFALLPGDYKILVGFMPILV